jgi:Fatty-acid desaturase
MATADLELVTMRAAARNQVNWLTTSIMAAFHAGAIAALFFISWKALLLVAVLWYISGSLGIGMGYHRLLTHRGYKVPRWVEYFLTTCAVRALEGGPIFWVATHRVHHQFSDQEGDPHSPRDGKWWSHMGWILMGETLHENTAALSRYAPDLAKTASTCGSASGIGCRRSYSAWPSSRSAAGNTCSGALPSASCSACTRPGR